MLFCCCNSCTIGSDDFGRADGSDITTGSALGWDESVGSWSLSSGQLVTSSTNAFAQCLAAHPDGIASAVVLCDLSGNTGDKPRVLVGFSSTSTTFFAELTVGSPGCLALYRRAGGTETLLASVPMTLAANTPANVTVYFDNVTTKQFAATAEVSGVTTTVSAILASFFAGPYVGLGTGGTAAACVFDNFVFKKYQQSGDSSSCPSIGTLDPCIVVVDDFHRSNSGSLGCGWDQQAGTSAIASNKLSITASNTRVLCLTRNLTDDPCRASADFVASSTNDVVQVIVNSDVTMSGYFYGELKIGTSGTLKLFQFAGSASQVGSTVSVNTGSAPFTGTMRVCISGTALTATVYKSNGDVLKHVTASVTPASGSRYAGLATGTVGSSVTFSSFTFERYTGIDGSHCVACDQLGTCLDGSDGVTMIVIPGIVAVTMSFTGTHNESCTGFEQCGPLNGSIELTGPGPIGPGGHSSCITNHLPVGDCLSWDNVIERVSTPQLCLLCVSATITKSDGVSANYHWAVQVVIADGLFGFTSDVETIRYTSSDLPTDSLGHIDSRGGFTLARQASDIVHTTFCTAPSSITLDAT